jgi:hypothetical protein
LKTDRRRCALEEGPQDLIPVLCLLPVLPQVPDIMTKFLPWREHAFYLSLILYQNFVKERKLYSHRCSFSAFGEQVATPMPGERS